MIVTRRRRKPFPWKRYLYPVLLVGAVAPALWWTPSRTWLAQGPVTSPVWRVTQPVWKPFAAVFDVAGQTQTIRTQQAQIDSLGRQLADARSQINDRDKQISSLQSQLDQAQQDAAVAKAAHPSFPATSPNAATAALSTGRSAAVANDLTANATPDMRRTAQFWAAMDSEQAAKLVQHLPDAYVARIFALMPPDAVGAILENLPAGYAARLTQEHPELRR